MSIKGQAIAYVFSECGHVYRYEVAEHCQKYNWWSPCDAWDEQLMPKRSIINRPYCRECFSKKRRRITKGFVKLEEAITLNGEKVGLASEQIEEVQAETRRKLAERLEQFDKEYLGQAESAVAVS